MGGSKRITAAEIVTPKPSQSKIPKVVVSLKVLCGISDEENNHTIFLYFSPCMTHKGEGDEASGEEQATEVERVCVALNRVEERMDHDRVSVTTMYILTTYYSL